MFLDTAKIQGNTLITHRSSFLLDRITAADVPRPILQMTDRDPSPFFLSLISVLGYLLAIGAMLLLGPAPFLPLEPTPGMVNVASLLEGVANAFLVRYL